MKEYKINKLQLTIYLAIFCVLVLSNQVACALQKLTCSYEEHVSQQHHALDLHKCRLFLAQQCGSDPQILFAKTSLRLVYICARYIFWTFLQVDLRLHHRPPPHDFLMYYWSQCHGQIQVASNTPSAIVESIS